MTQPYPPARRCGQMLHRIDRIARTDPNLVDRTEDRLSLQGVAGEPVLFSGYAARPESHFERTGQRVPGGPEYTVLGPAVSRDNPSGYAVPRHGKILNPHGVTVQPYDPTGRLTPDQLADAIAIDHIKARQDSPPAPPLYRELEGPVVGAGTAVKYQSADRYGINESVAPVASSTVNELIDTLLQRQPEQRLETLRRAEGYFNRLHEQRGIAYDITRESIENALDNLYEVVAAGGDIGQQLNALRLPVYVAPVVR